MPICNGHIRSIYGLHTALFIFSLLHLLNPANSLAQNNIGGYFRPETGIQIAAPNGLVYARNVLELNLSEQETFPWIGFSAQIRQDISNGTFNDLEFRLREAYVPIYTEKSDWLIGRQMITWGRSDVFQLHDILTPYDLREFLTQDFADLRLGVTAVNATFYGINNSLQLILIPRFASTRTPDPGSRWNFIPAGNFTLSPSDTPEFRPENIQIGAMWSVRHQLSWDLDAGFFHGFANTPSYAKQLPIQESGLPGILTIQKNYARSAALLASGEYRLPSGPILMAESIYWFRRYSDITPRNLAALSADPLQLSATLAHYNTRNFQRVTGQLSTSVGVQSNWFNWQLSTQVLLEYLTRHRADTMQDQYYTSLSLIASRSLLRERLAIRILSRYNVNASDYWFNPDFRYTLRDGLNASAGLHYFGGRPSPQNYGHLNYDTFHENSFAYLKLSLWW